MSNARNLSDLLGTGTTIATASIADDAITSAKIADDAVVTAAIADDAITSALIATDAVVADGLSSSAIASGDLPAGTVVKVGSQSSQLSSQPSTTLADVGIPEISMTRTISGSKFLCLLSGGRSIVNGTSSGYFTFFFAKEGSGSYASVSGTGGANSLEFQYNANGGQETQQGHTAAYLYTPTSSTANVSFKVYAQRYNSTNPGAWNQCNAAGARVFFTVMEIAG